MTMSNSLLETAAASLAQIERDGLLKRERVLYGAQSAQIDTTGTSDKHTVLNMCANNYLGLADDPRLINAAKAALDSHGFGMASVRFICGTQDLHLLLEKKIADFLGVEDSILFSSCFDANAGVFEALLDEHDAIISDSLNHASIIDGVRLCKAARFRYTNNDMRSLEDKLRESQTARHRLIVTDGVFSMDGTLANLPEICELAQQYDAIVMVDDSHAVGFVGETGAGTPQHHGVASHVHLLSGTFGKALGGASGGYIAGPHTLIGLLRQRARPYLFSNALAPPICAATIEALHIVSTDQRLRTQVQANATHFREGLCCAGFELIPGEHAIIPIMIGDAHKAGELAAKLLDYDVYVTAFSFPVVPKGLARIRTQISAVHTHQQLDRAIEAFTRAGKETGVLAS